MRFPVRRASRSSAGNDSRSEDGSSQKTEELIEEDSPLPTPAGIPEADRLKALADMRRKIMAPHDTAASAP